MNELVTVEMMTPGDSRFFFLKKATLIANRERSDTIGTRAVNNGSKKINIRIFSETMPRASIHGEIPSPSIGSFWESGIDASKTTEQGTD